MRRLASISQYTTQVPDRLGEVVLLNDHVRPHRLHQDIFLDELAAASWHGLTSPDLTFAPLLPSDDAPIEEQVQALALWCHGFLGGLGFRSAGDVQQRDGAIAEILADFAEISRAGLSDDEAAGRGQPDFALAEIQEYVRVSVQIVFEELSDQRVTATRDRH